MQSGYLTHTGKNVSPFELLFGGNELIQNGKEPSIRFAELLDSFGAAKKTSVKSSAIKQLFEIQQSLKSTEIIPLLAGDNKVGSGIENISLIKIIEATNQNLNKSKAKITGQNFGVAEINKPVLTRHAAEVLNKKSQSSKMILADEPKNPGIAQPQKTRNTETNQGQKRNTKFFNAGGIFKNAKSTVFQFADVRTALNKTGEQGKGILKTNVKKQTIENPAAVKSKMKTFTSAADKKQENVINIFKSDKTKTAKKVQIKQQVLQAKSPDVLNTKIKEKNETLKHKPKLIPESKIDVQKNSPANKYRFNFTTTKNEKSEAPILNNKPVDPNGNFEKNDHPTAKQVVNNENDSQKQVTQNKNISDETEKNEVSGKHEVKNEIKAIEKSLPLKSPVSGKTDNVLFADLNSSKKNKKVPEKNSFDTIVQRSANPEKKQAQSPAQQKVKTQSDKNSDQNDQQILIKKEVKPNEHFFRTQQADKFHEVKNEDLPGKLVGGKISQENYQTAVKTDEALKNNQVITNSGISENIETAKTSFEIPVSSMPLSTSSAHSVVNTFFSPNQSIVAQINQFLEIAKASKSNVSKFKIDLGQNEKYEIQFTKHGDSHSAKIFVGSEASLSSIEKIIPDLKIHLESKGINFVSVDVELNNFNGENANNENRNMNQNHQGYNMKMDNSNEQIIDRVSATRNFGYNTIEILA